MRLDKLDVCSKQWKLSLDFLLMQLVVCNITVILALLRRIVVANVNAFISSSTLATVIVAVSLWCSFGRMHRHTILVGQNPPFSKKYPFPFYCIPIFFGTI